MNKEIESFLSDAHAIQHSTLPLWARYTILWMMLFFTFGIIWACVGKVDVIVNANGKLVSSHPTIVVKPLERGVVKKIHVAIGDRVRAGDVLITFDTVFSAADKERLATEVKIAEALFNRLNAEFNDQPYNIPDKPNEEDLVQSRIYQDRQKYFAEKNEFFDKDIDRIIRTRDALKENLDLQEKRLAAFKDIEGMMSRAHTSKAVSQRDLKEAQIARMQLESEIGDKKNNILVLGSELASREAEKKAFINEWQIGISDELAKTKATLTNARKEYAKASQMNSYVELRAPEEAVVHDIMPMSIGSAVREAETMMTLVPVGGDLEVEAEIRAEDIALVKPGDKAPIKVSAFPFQKYGTVPGSVRVISEDAFVREDPRLGGSFYRARIGLNKPEKNDFQLIEKLLPGMEAQAEIVVGTRRVIEYLIHPLIKSLDEAIHEP